MGKDIEEDEAGEIDKMGRKDSKKQKESKEKTIRDFRLFLTLNFRAEPEEESRPKDEHDEWSAGAGDKEERDRENGHDAG